MRTQPIFAKTLTRGRHVRSFRIRSVPAAGWIASEEADHEVVLRREYADWHRVERTARRFMAEVADLRRRGWVDA
jgi:hypothetical protein